MEYPRNDYEHLRIGIVGPKKAPDKSQSDRGRSVPSSQQVRGDDWMDERKGTGLSGASSVDD